MENANVFRVVIVGASIAGLTLAHCLHKAGIDFIILEKHQDVTVRIGASLIIFPNGAVTLEQLGLYDSLQTQLISINQSNLRFGRKAKLLLNLHRHMALVEKRTGYPIAVTTRWELITTLFNRFPQKDKVLTNHLVTNVEYSSKGVSIHCQNGACFKGDIVVGADGVHSIIRAEMWRNAATASPDAFCVEDKTSLAAEYKLAFGVSEDVEGLPLSQDQRVINKSFSFIIVPLSCRRFAWYLSVKLDRKQYTPNISKYSQKDTEALVQSYLDLSITDHVVFRDVWDKRIMSNTVPIDEYLAERWTWNRFVCIGDAIHKFCPNNGQGGNNAIEDAAALTNYLKRLIENNSKTTLDTALIESCLQEFQKSRYQDVKEFDRMSRMVLRNETLDGSLDRFVVKYLLPNIPDFVISTVSNLAIGATCLDYLPLGRRRVKKGNMNIEKRENIGRRVLRASPILLVLLASVFIIIPNVGGPIITGRGRDDKYEINSRGVLANSWGYKFPPDSIMYRLFLPSQILAELELLTEFYSAMITNEFARARVLAGWFDFNAILGIWMVEAFRRGNSLSFAQIPFLFVFILKVRGWAIGVSLYCFFHYVQNPITNHRAPDLRHVRMDYAMTLLPAILVGYTFPTVYLLFFAPSSGSPYFENFISMWQFFPATVPIFHRLFASFIPKSKDDFVDRPYADLVYLRIFYAACGLISAIAYWHTALNFSIISIYHGPISFITGSGNPGSLGDLWAEYLPVDILGERLPMLYFIVLSFRDLKAAGKLTLGWISLSSLFIAIAAVFSPGTAFLAAWAYREELLAL